MSESAKRIDTLNDRISELKSGLKGLRAERKAGTIDEEAYNERVAQTTQELAANRAEVKALQSAMRTYSREIHDNIKEEKNLEGAVNGLRASIRNLTAEYNALSAADRRCHRQWISGANIQDTDASQCGRTTAGEFPFECGKLPVGIQRAECRRVADRPRVAVGRNGSGHVLPRHLGQYPDAR